MATHEEPDRIRRPNVQPTDRVGMDRSQLGALIPTAEGFDHDHAPSLRRSG